MSISTSNILPLKDRGIWGDMFCIHWLPKWLNIPIRVWSKTKINPYLYFNSTLANNIYDILFHDENPRVGHFETLLFKRQTHTINSHLHNEESIKYKDIEQQWLQMKMKMLAYGLE